MQWRWTGIALLLTWSLTSAGAWLELQATVTRVPDGNNLRVTDRKGIAHLVRLSGCDAPESTQPGGEAAWRRLRALVEDREIRIVHRFFDAKGRLLGKVYVGDVWVNRVLIEEGLAWYSDPDRDCPELAGPAAQARTEKLGLWKVANPVPPWHWRAGARHYRPGMETVPPPVFPRYQSTNEPKLIGTP